MNMAHANKLGYRRPGRPDCVCMAMGYRPVFFDTVGLNLTPLLLSFPEEIK